MDKRTRVKGEALRKDEDRVRVERVRHLTAEAWALLEEYYAAIGVAQQDGAAAMERMLEDFRSGMWVAFAGGATAGPAARGGGRVRGAEGRRAARGDGGVQAVVCAAGVSSARGGGKADGRAGGSGGWGRDDMGVPGYKGSLSGVGGAV